MNSEAFASLRPAFRAVACLLSALLFPALLSAGININVNYVKRSVVFLYGSDSQGNIDSANPLGTGFVVQIPLISQPKKAWKLLVTARHIADPQWAGCPTRPSPTIFMRVNVKDYEPAKNGNGTADIALTGKNVGSSNWYFSDDPEVDAAAIPIDGSLLDNYDVDGLHISDFPTVDELKDFAEGDAIVSAGLLPGASGRKRNYPIFKFGNISSIPEEPADAPRCGSAAAPAHLVKLWFIAASLVPGNSGSPILYVPSGFSGMITVGLNTRPVFLGIQSSSFIPWDVAGMTPAKYVFDLIEEMKVPDADLRRGPPSKPGSADQK